MRDEIIRFFGGPRDGEAVKLTPHFLPMRADEVDAKGLPPTIDVDAEGLKGRYELDRQTKRYEWRER
jgi:hypothetical protein